MRAAAAFLPTALALAFAPPRAQDAEALWNEGRRADAITALIRDLEQRPADAALRRALADREIAVHRYQAALEHLRPLGSEVDRLRGLALYRLDRFEEALRLLAQDDPEHLLMRQAALEALGRIEEADAAVDSLQNLLGDADPRVRVLIGARHARAERWDDAIQAFRAALDLDPWSGQALFGLGRALVESGKRDEGLAVLQRHRDLVPKLDQLDFARRGVDLAPNHAPNRALLADAERELGRFDAAQSEYELATRLAAAGELVPIALRHARLYSEYCADVDGAVRVLEEAASRVPDARLFVRSGDLLLAAGRGIDAVQRFYRARELRPDDPQIAERIEAARQAYRQPQKP